MSKTILDYAWLKQFCGDYGRLVLPFKTKMPGYDEDWFAATDGKRAVVLQSLEGGLAPKDVLGDGPNLASLLAKESIQLQMTSRQGIIDNYPAMERVECPRCQGRGTWSCSDCDGKGHRMRECPDCGHEHSCVCNECNNGTVTCPTCDGEKITWKESIETWTRCVLGVPINGQLLVPILASLDDEQVAISYLPIEQNAMPTRALKVSGAAWTVLVCERSNT